jgi:hypothetical protein
MRVYQHILLIGAFVFLLFSIFLGSVFHWDFRKDHAENRRLAPFPVFSETPVSEWPAKFEAYFNDHFGFRNTLIRRYNRLMKKAGKSNRAIVGEDGWLFYNTDSIIKDFIGRQSSKAPRPVTQLERLESRRDWLEMRGVDYLFVIIPNKSTVYPEKMPRHIREIQSRTHRQNLVETLDGRFDPNFIDLTPALQRAKRDEVVYIRTDTHWNPKGAFIGYTNMVGKLRNLLPDLSPALSISDLESSRAEHVGDVAKMTGTPEKYRLTIEKLDYPAHKIFETEEIADPHFLTEENMPLNNMPPFTVHNPEGTYNAVVFHDSFTRSMMQLIPHHFKNTTFIWRFTNAERLQLAVEYGEPDIIIEAIAERFLVVKASDALRDTIPVAAAESDNK